VSDAGLVQNYTNLLVPSVDISVKSFNIPIPKTSGTPGSRPHLLVVAASMRPLSAIQQLGTASADQVFRDARAEAQRTGQHIAVMVRYFRVER
jgi:hypothetical protein